MSFVAVCLGCIIVLILYWKRISTGIQNNSHLSKIPKLPLPCYPIIGHSLSVPWLSANFFTNLVNLTRKFSESSKVKLSSLSLSTRYMVWAIHPDAAEVILKSTRNISKASAYNFIQPWIKEGLVTSTGSKWQRRRKMITPSFHYDILKDFINIMNEHAAGFVDCIEQDILNGRQVDIKQRLKLCTLDIICETAMGCKIHAQDEGGNEYMEAIQKIGVLALSRRFNPFYKFDFIFNRTSVGRDHNKTLKIIHGFTRKVINKRLSETPSRSSLSTNRKAFLDMLIAAQTEDGRGLSADDIQEEVDTFMFAGHDTTTIALVWGIYILGRYPEKQKKLQEELDSVFAGDKMCDITFDHIKDLTYLDLVVKESLRLYPSVPLIGRTLAEDCVIDGLTIPKGQNVTVFIYFINRHPDIWENPNKFIPERFETENRLSNKKSPYSYIPFSAGPRNCIGQRFAIQELKVILAKFFRRFSVESYDAEEDINVKMGLVLENLQKLKIKVTDRKA